VRDGASEYESTRFDTGHLAYPLRYVRSGKGVDRLAEGIGIA